MKAACFSVAAMDYFPQRKMHYAGGNSLNQAIRFRKLGIDTTFLGALGTDEAGDRILDLMSRRGVDTTRVYRVDGITACNEIVNDVYGERFGVEGAWKNGVYADFCLSESDWDYIKDFEIWSTHANGINYRPSLARKKKNFLVVDFLHFEFYTELKDGADIIDIAYFGGEKRQEQELLGFSKETDTLIVLTLGCEGSIAMQRGISYYQEALPVETVVDTTGCGDAYQAAFSACYYRTRDVRQALAEGAAAGREAAQAYGGVSW